MAYGDLLLREESHQGSRLNLQCLSEIQEDRGICDPDVVAMNKVVEIEILDQLQEERECQEECKCQEERR
jgi:hypothetical protein